MTTEQIKQNLLAAEKQLKNIDTSFVGLKAAIEFLSVLQEVLAVMRNLRQVPYDGSLEEYLDWAKSTLDCSSVYFTSCKTFKVGCNKAQGLVDLCLAYVESMKTPPQVGSGLPKQLAILQEENKILKRCNGNQAKTIADYQVQARQLTARIAILEEELNSISSENAKQFSVIRGSKKLQDALVEEAVELQTKLDIYKEACKVLKGRNAVLESQVQNRNIRLKKLRK